MVVYGEYLFLENFITGLIITYITGQLCGVSTKTREHGRLRYGAIGILCGGYSFILFIDMNSLIALASKIVFALTVVCIAFSPQNIKVAIREAVAFIVVSFLMGGMTIGLIYLTRAQGISHNTAIYLEGVTYINVTIGVTATLMVGIWIKRFFGEKAQRQQLQYDVTIESKGQRFCLKGYVDSGNNLRDPITRRAVTILSQGSMARLRESGNLDDDRSIDMTYYTLGGQGIIKAYEVDWMKIENKYHAVEISKPLIAMYQYDFMPKNCYEYDALLSNSVLDS